MSGLLPDFENEYLFLDCKSLRSSDGFEDVDILPSLFYPWVQKNQETVNTITIKNSPVRIGVQKECKSKDKDSSPNSTCDEYKGDSLFDTVPFSLP